MNNPLPVITPPAPDRPTAITLDPRTYARGLSCVHCGLCLPTCPTYTETGNEADSPRGRIQLMLGLADGRIDLSPSVQQHLDGCLDCRACETACPSGVVYHELIEETREKQSHLTTPTAQGKLMRWLFFNLFTHPTRLKLAVLPARLLQKTGVYALLRKSGLFKLLPSQLRKMEQLLPATGPLWPARLAERVMATEAKGSVTFFSTCIGSVMFSRGNRMAVELLQAGRMNVRVPRGQVCCGAIHHHNGEIETARKLARTNIDALAGEGFITTCVAGCGAMLRDYGTLLRDDPAYAERARDFASRVRDVSEVLVAIDLPPMRHAVNESVTYHDACHLTHAQKVSAAPRVLLGKIPGLKLVPLPESDACCGAAGTYNLTNPEMATRLADRKLANIESTGASICAAGNIGCTMHIQSRANETYVDVQLVHTVELLHRAMFGPSSSSSGRGSG